MVLRNVPETLLQRYRRNIKNGQCFILEEKQTFVDGWIEYLSKAIAFLKEQYAVGTVEVKVVQLRKWDKNLKNYE